ncbi:MAG: hypothetical protein EAZ94_05670 [Oscillatoriales cyanobacterium]|nr:MAG: hypothetical protein EAZ94_05670 [Oscillatoriales cyanobacterium]TAE26375.1 MAG: hypothetical protein EAZ93_08680 [Oscillatoriales cyanobacterium]TAE68727.1 MAG: hypothetical protein EAZ86_12045 [Oscillatoriales cyanobacterium]TAG00166.1 MAG: hypothetical protein EAZ45_16040 [Oscillatoriales cyanobacterium]
MSQSLSDNFGSFRFLFPTIKPPCLAPLKKGGDKNFIKVPLFKGDLGGSPGNKNCEPDRLKYR